MKRIVPVLLIAFASAAHAATVAQWRADIEQIVADIRVNHPSPFTKTGELTFMRRIAALEESLPSLTDEQRVVEMMRIVASIGDGHTFLQPHRDDFGFWYPIRLYEFTDGIYITAAHKSVGDLAGAHVIEIAGRPVAEVLERVRDLMSSDNALDRSSASTPRTAWR